MTKQCECDCQGSVTPTVFRGTFNELQESNGVMLWISDHRQMWYWVNKASGNVPDSALEHAWKCYLPIILLSLFLCSWGRSPGSDWSTFILLMGPWMFLLSYTSYSLFSFTHLSTFLSLHSSVSGILSRTSSDCILAQLLYLWKDKVIKNSSTAIFSQTHWMMTLHCIYTVQYDI